jgi:branched-chain amino acid aminotransferase
MNNYFNHNGKIISADFPAIPAADHSYRYGDGLFETMKIIDGEICLADLHFERLFAGLKILKFQIPHFFTTEKITIEIKALCKKNNCYEKARVRLSVSRGSGGLYDCDNHFSYLIECWSLSPTIDKWNENGLVIDIFPDARKAMDAFSNLKSANYQPYVMAALWAKENKLNEALLLNAANHICDATTANIFWVKDEIIFTVPLFAGCVAGVIRRKIIESRSDINETELASDDLLKADEVFLTNSIHGIRWIKQCREKTYTNKLAYEIYSALFQTNK